MAQRKPNIKKEIRRHIRGINKYLTDEYLHAVSTFILLCNCHPLYRKAYAIRANQCGFITDGELSNFKTEG